jgi:hypothetical protein
MVTMIPNGNTKGDRFNVLIAGIPVMLNDHCIELECYKFKDKLCLVNHVIAQVDSYRLLPAAARVQSQVSSCRNFCG